MPYVEVWVDEPDVDIDYELQGYTATNWRDLVRRYRSQISGAMAEDVSLQGVLDDPAKRLEMIVALRNMGYTVEMESA